MQAGLLPWRDDRQRDVQNWTAGESSNHLQSGPAARGPGGRRGATRHEVEHPQLPVRLVLQAKAITAKAQPVTPSRLQTSIWVGITLGLTP